MASFVFVYFVKYARVYGVDMQVVVAVRGVTRGVCRD